MKKPAAAKPRKKSEPKKPLPRKVAALMKPGNVRESKITRHRQRHQDGVAKAADAMARKAKAAVTKLAGEIKQQIDASPKPVNREPFDTLDELEHHPLSGLLPMMIDTELEALRDDVMVNGQRDPVVLFEGKILDGRNRYAVLSVAGLPVNARNYDPATEGDPADYVYSKAVHRNMTDSQKACSSVKFKRHLQATVGKSKGSSVGTSSHDEKFEAREEAGKRFGVSGRYVSMAEALEQADEKLFDACFRNFNPDPDPKKHGKPFHITVAIREYRRRTKKAVLKEKADAAPAHAQAGDRSRIITGDALKVLPTIEEKARLAFLDPKYNLKRSYDNGAGIVDDDMTPAEYRAWLASLVTLSAATLTDDGSICVMIHARWLALVCTTLEDLGLHWRDTFVWQYNFGNSRSAHTGFTPSYVPIVHFTRHATRHLFNGESVMVPSKRMLPVVCPTCRARSGYDDARGNEDGKVMDNVFDVPRLVDNHPEKVPSFDNQVPLDVMDPIVRALTDPGDLILDPGVGSGSTGVSAVTNGRRFLGIEVVADNAEMAGVRIAAAYADHLQKPALPPKERKPS